MSQEVIQNPSTNTAVVEAPPQKKPEVKPPETLPPYKLILHNDDVSSMVDVVRTIVNLTPLGIRHAIRCMLEAHHKSYSLLLVTHRERGELYVEQFASCRLITTLEPA
ncbi:MAG: hypothetical protein HJJLKODD_00366 [Phycisphaerae bacterium]|nr:hypothetical protein [Phycisphaerae bacterium]